MDVKQRDLEKAMCKAFKYHLQNSPVSHLYSVGNRRNSLFPETRKTHILYFNYLINRTKSHGCQRCELSGVHCMLLLFVEHRLRKERVYLYMVLVVG